MNDLSFPIRPGLAQVSWTDEACGTLRRLVDAGKSASEIASAMRDEHPWITRNAVIGKCDRLGVKLGRAVGENGVTLRSRLAPTIPESRVGKGKTQRSHKMAPPERRVKLHDGTLAPLHLAMPEPLAGYPGLKVQDLTESVCHWPNGDSSDLETFRYCGAPVAKRKYCAHHYGMAYIQVFHAV